MRAMLREATRSLHLSLEMRLAPLLQTDSLDAYRDLLLTFYGFIPPLEDQILRILGLEAFPTGYELKERRPLLVRDLLDLGFTERQLAALAPCPEVPRIETRHQALGCLYVLEGSRLGGQHLYRQFEASLRISPASGGSFLHGEGPRTGLRWRRFIAVLDADPAPEEARLEAVDAACRTFLALEGWIARRLRGALDG